MAGKIDMAVNLGKEALESPAIKSAAEEVLSASQKLLRDAMPASAASATEKIGDAASDLFSRFDSSNYRFVPARNLATEIRTGGDVTMGNSDGPAKIVFGEDHAVKHISFAKTSTGVERADHLLTAGYANMIHDDGLAREAASKVMGQSAGFMSHPIERYATEEEMHQNAIDGAQAYTSQDATKANKFTNFLTERFGPFTNEQKEWGRHIMTTPDKEGVFSSGLSTPTEIPNGIPITPEHRAAASNSELSKQSPWLRGNGIRGVANYLESLQMPGSSLVDNQTAWKDLTAAQKDATFGK